MNDEPHLDRNALNENIQRTVDRTALRKVRKLADELQARPASEAAQLLLELPAKDAYEGLTPLNSAFVLDILEKGTR